MREGRRPGGRPLAGVREIRACADRRSRECLTAETCPALL